MRILSTIMFGLIASILALALSVQAKDGETPSKSKNMIKITVGEHEFTAMLEESSTVTAFLKKLPLTIQMNDFNGNEKCYTFPEHFPSNSVNHKQIKVGDLMLFGNATLVLFYEGFSTSYNYTKIGKIIDASTLKNALRSGNPIVKFELIK